MKPWEIERMFQDEIREKKKTGNGVFSRSGKGVRNGFNSALRTPFYYMKQKERNKLNGEVNTYNFQTILPLEEFNRKDEATQKLLMSKWRELYSNLSIMKEMGIGGQGTFAQIVNRLDLPKKTKGGQLGRIRKSKNAEVQLSPLEMESGSIPSVTIPVVNGLHLQYNGEFDSEQISKIFNKLQVLTEGDNSKFILELSIKQV